MSKETSITSERRSFLTRLNAGAASIAALALGGAAMAQKPAAAARWAPARHEKDDWMDAVPGEHRLVFDTTSGTGFQNAVLFAGNFIIANKNDYGLEPQDLAIIVIARHLSTGYGFNDKMWAKYGASLGGEESQKTNPAAAALTSLSKQGVQFAVCSMATRRIAGLIARAAGLSADAAVAELTANLVASARFVPAGIVAVNRAQERGYSLVTA